MFGVKTEKIWFLFEDVSSKPSVSQQEQCAVPVEQFGHLQENILIVWALSNLVNYVFLAFRWVSLSKITP